MKFRYVIEEKSNNGASDTSVRDLDKDEVILGRGSACDILFDSRIVSLSHAKVFLSGNSLVIEDLQSLSGLRVNGEVVSRKELKVGDSIKLGDVTLRVIFDGGIWGFYESRSLGQKEDVEQLAARQVDKLRLANRIPFGFAALAVISMVLVAGIFFALPLMGVNPPAWSSGPISNKHRMIADKCNYCHGDPFQRVPDKKCENCHSMTNHAPSFKDKGLHAGLQIRCAQCHMEHNGDPGQGASLGGGRGMIAHESALCTNCHKNIKATLADAKSPDVPDFENHPQFLVRIQPSKPGGSPTRVSLDDPANLKDNSFVKLNHEKHLSELKSKTGRVRLDCRDCHKIADDFRSIEKISFVKHCQSCHSLEFDERLVGKEVPHGDADVIYKFLYAEYAKLALVSQEDASVRQNFDIRLIPGGGVASSNDSTKTREDFVKDFVEKESRNAEKTLFERTACYLCHKILPKEISEQDSLAQQVSKYEVIKPQIPEHWMPLSIFGHGAHEELKCVECHEKAPTSTRTNDVLMPKREKCLPCHSQSGKDSHGDPERSRVKSECIMCHSFHRPLVMKSTAKRSTEDLLSSLH